MLNFIQLNLHKATQATVVLGQELKDKQQTLAFLMEPHTVANKITGLPKGTTIAYARNIPDNKPGPRTGIVASCDLKLNAMDAWCNRDCTVAMIKLHGRQVVVASVYLDITKSTIPDWLERLMDMIDNKKVPLILAIDTNAHSSLFGPDTNSRGEDLEDFVISRGLEIQNVGETPTFETRRGTQMVQTFIDATFTRDLHFDISNWRVDRSYNASDHNTIRFEAEATTTGRTRLRPWSKADWQLFKDHLRNAEYRIPTHMSMKKLDALVDRLYKNLNEALNKACPEITVKDAIRSQVWITDKHEELKREVTKLYQKAKRQPTTLNWENYKLADKSFKRVCKRDKDRAWRQYKESLQSEKDMASLAKLAQREERRDINVLMKSDGTSTDPGKETITLLTQTHFPAATDARHVSYNNRRNCLTLALEDKYTDWITSYKIKQALGGFEKKKSPGPDGIKPLVFEHLPEEFINALEVIYKAAIHLSYTPKQWKRTKVIFISKPGKESYEQPKSFRPISLSNYFLKGLERLVAWNMDKALISYPIHHKQHGFLSGKSTESAISNTTDYIESFIMRKQHCVGVFLDISSAFDSINPNHVRRALLDHGGEPEMVQWYYNYITHRDIEIDMHGEQASFSTGIGFPQGGVCSAKFWLIAFDFAIKIINMHNIEGNGYADDCSALYGGPRLDHAISRLQRMLDSLTAWGRRCGLKFNPEKSVAVLFTRRQKTPPRPLLIDGKPIQWKEQVKYLGLTLDKKLHWNKHIEDKVRSAKKFISHVAHITRKNWGPKPQLMRWAYLGIVRPRLTYASMIWGHRAPHHIDKLRRLNRLAMNTFGCYPKSTPTASLEVMLDVAPLHLFCQQEALAARARLNGVVSINWSGKNHLKTHSTSHLRHWEDIMTEANINLATSDQCSEMKWSTGFRIDHDSFSGHSKHLTPTQYNIFTDGSRLDGQSGTGFAIYKGKKEIHTEAKRLPDYATVFQAEIMAIRRAADAMLCQAGSPIKFVKFFIDSQAAILALANPMVRNQSVSDAIDSLNKLYERALKVTLVWIPAHRGHIGNERADRLAKQGSKLSGDNDRVFIAKPGSAIKNEIRSLTYKSWAKEWQEDPRFAHTKAFYFSPMPTKAKYVYKLARLELGRFVRLITGHNNLNAFQTRIGLWGDKTCRFCLEADETFLHLLHSCPRFWQEQRDYFCDKIPSSDMQWSVRSLLDFSYIPSINDAFEGTWAHGDPQNQNDLQSEESDVNGHDDTSSYDPEGRATNSET